ncbi:MAG: hypothetical protein M1358_20135 [Chloroflexi bacterium]|nr:hypothetical protein [Chloroflexota bacterium]
MLGILQGMKVTLEHAFRKKITHVYPYEKPRLPERSRGLIQLIREPETGVLKCEACLLCEKVCPPRAITISYRFRNAFRRRPLFRPRTQSAFYRPRMSTPAPYQGRPASFVFDLPDPSAAPENTDELVERILAGSKPDADVMEMLEAVQDAVGYLPQQAARRISDSRQLPMYDLYALATLNPSLRLTPEGNGIGGGDGR